MKEMGRRYASKMSWGQCGGESRDIRDVPTRLCVIPHGLDRLSEGQTGYFHVKSGTRPQDVCGPAVGVSHRISVCLVVFWSRKSPTQNQMENRQTLGVNRDPEHKLSSQQRQSTRGLLMSN